MSSVKIKPAHVKMDKRAVQQWRIHTIAVPSLMLPAAQMGCTAVQAATHVDQIMSSAIPPEKSPKF